MLAEPLPIEDNLEIDAFLAVEEARHWLTEYGPSEYWFYSIRGRTIKTAFQGTCVFAMVYGSFKQALNELHGQNLVELGVFAPDDLTDEDTELYYSYLDKYWYEAIEELCFPES